ncbi:MAG TPA: bifunctional demethylmenaquinone methyltransferase/2-methoxy-6-polyprenyl-1,4-benzoquinol methylase UbiE [Hanamia sp.]|jgi:demethylmenaquinone methyltransferase/2-methoxy-6-polyprenyl-1,4-benzoquinol methylase|nr:bifunctional demethylmenaquinone methyltransferase/2-methoxy-6-polyprenyl-1,4-benzoquinol methylase UbiE [Hanamia sp.]
MNIYPHDTVVPFKDSKESKKKQVEDMFDKIAFRYDFLNRFLSAGIDVGWRKKAIKLLLPSKPKNILDVATGTGDFALTCYKILKPEKITGIDISEGMLKLGRKKIEEAALSQKIQLLKGDSEAILFDDNTFDAVTVAFGVRNFENLEKGLAEIRRVLKPGGKLIVLECTKPSTPVIRQLYNFYMKTVTPKIGEIIAKNNEAYQYLNDSVLQFPEKESFIHILNQSSYRNAFYKTLTLGICSIYCAEK